MDKEPPYETFQFIETSNTNSDMNQLLVMQENGTLLSIKEEIGNAQTCAVFDISSEQFYVDVDNASNLIVPPEQFTTQHPDGNIYANSFLIQPENNSAAEPMETDLSESQHNESEAVNSNQSANNFAEITLTDAQYHLLEQNGWVLLEFSERIFVLDTLGLHDITDDEKSVQKLRSKLESATDPQIEPGQVMESVPTTVENIKNVVYEFKLSPVTATDLTESREDVIDDTQTVNENSDQESSDIIITEAETTKLNLDLQQSDEIDKKCDSIKIKTKYTFSDIPDKIFLGKTANGKKLYAKITKSKHKEMMNMKMCRKTCESDTNVEAIDNVQFINMVQEYVREHPSGVKAGCVAAADSAVTQLMHTPRIRDAVLGNHIVVTKTVIFVTADGKEKTRRKPTTITGEVKLLDGTHGRFVHTPYMLHNMAFKESNMPQKADDEDKITQELVEFVHIHITETKVQGRPSVQAINVSNRKLSLDVLRDAKKRHPNPVYACGACAAVFKSQSTLTDHLENSCSGILEADPDDTLTIDTDQVNDKTETYYKLDSGNEKWYACIQCEATFSKLFNCKKHIKSHSKPLKKNQDSDEPTNQEIKEYKCKMCSCKFFHASSLSKHIVKRHIQVHYNNSNKPPVNYKLFYFLSILQINIYTAINYHSITLNTALSIVRIITNILTLEG